MKLILSLLAMAGLFLTGCSQAPADTHDADVKVLRELEEKWNAEIQSKDAVKWASYYAEDATLMAPGMKAMKGRPAITEGLKMLTSDPNMSLKFSAATVEVAKSGDLAATQGNYTMTMTNPANKEKITDTGTYVTVYKKQADGSWKAYFDASVSEVPPK